MPRSVSTTFTFSNTLTPEQSRFFQTHGVLHFKGFVSPETVQLFIREINRVKEDFVSRNVTKVNGIPLKYGYESSGKPTIQRLAFASQFSSVLSEFLKDRRFTSLLPLLGDYQGRIGEHEKDGLVVNHYENTRFSSFKQLGWHTDSPRDLFLGSRIMPMLNVGLHLDDCPVENGGLRVLPGTHKQNLFSLFFKKKYFIDNKPDKNEVGFDIHAGDLTIHNGNVWHRVEQSPFTGEKSRRRVMYIPIITGEYSPKHAKSSTPFYHRLAQIKLPQSAWKQVPQQI
ncbi:MAG: phytanoyl-CoA dioxygenase family protein [Williamsia sp.]|nr:phytanoyl-CoA dioxygenase family protein [Williamsia sp.]